MGRGCLPSHACRDPSDLTAKYYVRHHVHVLVNVIFLLLQASPEMLANEVRDLHEMLGSFFPSTPEVRL
jgi:hypothetical protein